MIAINEVTEVKMRLKACAIALVLISMIFCLIPVPVNATSFAINPAIGSVGMEVAISSICSYGSGDYYIYWGDAQELIKQGTAEGCVTVNFTVPDSPRGKHTITLKISGKTFTADFTVIPSFVLSTYDGNVGSTITVSGTGFNTNETGIQVTFGGDPVISGINADRNGNWQGTFKVPAGKAGEHIVDAFGVTPASDVEDLTFLIKAKIDINPTSGGVGTTVTVEGNGFSSGETDISILYDDMVQKTAIAANNVGFWRSSFNVPPSTRGIHSITAFGEDTQPGLVSDVAFTISPAVKLELSSGFLGSPVNIDDSLWVSGIGFEENESGIQVTYDGAMIASGIIADAKGSWAIQVDVPLSTEGKHVISAAGSTTKTEDVNSASLMVSPSVSLVPDSGDAGQDISVKGLGFGAIEAITVSFDGNKVSQGIATDSRGSFMSDFKVPKAKGGEHTVIATDATGAVASTSFTMESNAPATPELIAPEAGAKLDSSWGSAVVVFHWEAVEDPSGTSYILEISRDSAFSGIVVRKEGLKDNEYTLTKDEALTNGEYYWRVKTVDGALNESPWSAGQIFTIKGFELSLIIIGIVIGLIIIGLIVWRVMKISKKGGWH
jgi:hypothetical protein